MMLKVSGAKIVDLDVSLDATPVDTRLGPVVWASVTIQYTLAGLSPCVTIRVPLPWREGETTQDRRAEALRCARQLIDHACRATGAMPEEDEDRDMAPAIGK